MIYAINAGKRSIFYFIILLALFIPLAKYAYKQEFMSEKIDTYLEQNEKVVLSGFEEKKYTRLTRLEAVYLGLVHLKEWPLGFGVVTEGRITNDEGKILVGSNALIEIAIKWGLIGFVFFLFSFFRYSYIYYLMNGKNKSYLFLLIPLLIMFFSNPVDRTPIFMGIIFYPFIYGRYFKKYILLRKVKIA